MGRITKLIRSLREIIRTPGLLNLVLSDNSVWEKFVLRRFGLKTGLPIIPLDELIPEFNDTFDVMTCFDGGCLPTDIALLKAICRKFPACSYFEIGTWRGESVKNVSGVAAECYTLDLTNEEFSRKNFPDDCQQIIGDLSEGIANVKQLKGDSMDFDFSSLDRKFDVIFIDGDHRYEFVKNDTVKVFRHLLHDQSAVVWHDYAYSPGKVRYEVLAGILDGVPKTYRHCLYQVSGSKCAIFTREKTDPEKLQTTSIHEDLFRVTLERQK